MHIIMPPQYVAFLVKLMARTKADLRSARNAMAAERNNRSRSRDGPRDGGAGGAGGGAASASGAADGREIDDVAAAEVMPAAERTAAVAAAAFVGPIPQTPAPPGACRARWLKLGPDGRRGRGNRDAVAAALDSVAHYDGAVGGEDGERTTLVPLVPREKRVRTHRQTTTTTREDEDEWQGIKTPRSTRTGTIRRTKRYTTTATTITVVTVVESDTDNDSETL